jgi:hypothetical protein
VLERLLDRHQIHCLVMVELTTSSGFKRCATDINVCLEVSARTKPIRRFTMSFH